MGEGAQAFIRKWRKLTVQLIRKCHEASPNFMAFLELMTVSSQACLFLQVRASSKAIWFSAALGLVLCSAHDPVTEYQLITFHNNVAWISFEVQEEALYKALAFAGSCCLSGTPAGRRSLTAVPRAVGTPSLTEGQLQFRRRGQGTELILQQ